jgi:hypothetical protein
MKLTITEHFFGSGSTYYRWELWDGPADSSDYMEGRGATVRQCMLQIANARREIARNNGTAF